MKAHTSKASSGERCLSCNFVLLVLIGLTPFACLIVNLTVYQMKKIMERQMLQKIQLQLYPPEQPHWHEDITKTFLFLWCLWRFKRLFLVFHCWILGSVANCLPTEIKVKTNRNYKTCKHRYKLSHNNQMGQSTVLKITASQQSLTTLTGLVTTKKLLWTVTMTANI